MPGQHQIEQHEVGLEVADGGQAPAIRRRPRRCRSPHPAARWSASRPGPGRRRPPARATSCTQYPTPHRQFVKRPAYRGSAGIAGHGERGRRRARFVRGRCGRGPRPRRAPSTGRANPLRRSRGTRPRCGPAGPRPTRSGRGAARSRPLPVRGALGGDGAGHVQEQVPVGDGEAEPLDLQRVHPGDELPAGPLVQPGRAVGGVRGDVAVDEHEVVAGDRRYEDRRRPHGGPARRAPPSRARSRRRRPAVRAGRRGPARRARRRRSGERRRSWRGRRARESASSSRRGERVLPGPVEALDDDQSSHGRR